MVQGKFIETEMEVEGMLKDFDSDSKAFSAEMAKMFTCMQDVGIQNDRLSNIQKEHIGQKKG